MLISYRSSCQDCFTLVSACRPAGYGPAVLYKAGSTPNYFTEFWFCFPLRWIISLSEDAIEIPKYGNEVFGSFFFIPLSNLHRNKNGYSHNRDYLSVINVIYM